MSALMHYPDWSGWYFIQHTSTGRIVPYYINVVTKAHAEFPTLYVYDTGETLISETIANTHSRRAPKFWRDVASWAHIEFPAPSYWYALR